MTLTSVQYQTNGTCCAIMNVVVDGTKIYEVEFLGGCNGNLKGIGQLVKGMEITDVIEKLQGIRCGSKSTSCPDQLAQCLVKLKNEIEVRAVK